MGSELLPPTELEAAPFGKQFLPGGISLLNLGIFQGAKRSWSELDPAPGAFRAPDLLTILTKDGWPLTLTIAVGFSTSPQGPHARRTPHFVIPHRGIKPVVLGARQGEGQMGEARALPEGRVQRPAGEPDCQTRGHRRHVVPTETRESGYRGADLTSYPRRRLRSSGRPPSHLGRHVRPLPQTRQGRHRLLSAVPPFEPSNIRPVPGGSTGCPDELPVPRAHARHLG